jgi:hypothetical protein
MDGADGFSADCGVAALGHRAHNRTGNEHPEMVLGGLVKVVPATGHIGVVRVYVPEDAWRIDQQMGWEAGAEHPFTLAKNRMSGHGNAVE